MSVATVQKTPPSVQKSEEASSKKPSSGLPRWAKISLVALTVIAVVAVAYYFYQPQAVEGAAKKFFALKGPLGGSNPADNFSSSAKDVIPVQTASSGAPVFAEGVKVAIVSSPSIQDTSAVEQRVASECQGNLSVQTASSGAPVFIEGVKVLVGGSPPFIHDTSAFEPRTGLQGSPSLFSGNQQTLDLIREKLKFYENENCKAMIRPAQAECKETGTNLNTMQGKRAYEAIQQEIQKECLDQAANPCAFSKYPNFSIWNAWRKVSYPQTLERVRALAEEQFLSRYVPPAEQTASNDALWRKIFRIWEACEREKCPNKADVFCKKEKCGPENLQYYRTFWGNGTGASPEQGIWIDKVAAALCPNSPCELSDQEIYDAVERKKPLPSSWFSAWNIGLGTLAVITGSFVRQWYSKNNKI